MTWFQPPQLRTGEGIEEESRHATWLELFFDLVFVVAVSQLAHNLEDDITLKGFLGFVVLFLPIWWAWIGATFYANRFDVDDIGHRLLSAVQMLGIAGMAINIHHGLGENSIGFALSYTAVRVILVFQYLRAAHHVSSARGLAKRYAFGFGIAAAFWLISVFVPIPLRFVCWAVGMLIDVGTPLSAMKFQARLLPHFDHLPERFGLFIIIVLGEAIIAVVNGVAEQEWQFLSVLAAMCGFIIAFSLWWIYFENVGGAALKAAGAQGQLATLQIWLYGHFPLVLGLTATGVAVQHIILQEPATALPMAERWLLCGSLAMCFLSLALLHRTGVIFRCKVRAKYRLWAAIALILIAVMGVGLSPILVVGCVAIVSVSQVAQDIYQGHPAPSSIDSENSSIVP